MNADMSRLSLPAGRAGAMVRFLAMFRGAQVDGRSGGVGVSKQIINIGELKHLAAEGVEIRSC